MRSCGIFDQVVASPGLAIKCYFELVRSSLAHAVLNQSNDLEFLRVIEGSFDRQVRTFGHPGLEAQGITVRQIVQNLVAPVTFERLRI